MRCAHVGPEGDILPKGFRAVPSELHIAGSLDLVLQAIVNTVHEEGIKSDPVVQSGDHVGVAERVCTTKQPNNQTFNIYQKKEKKFQKSSPMCQPILGLPLGEDDGNEVRKG